MRQNVSMTKEDFKMLLCDKTERSRGTLKSGLDITSGCPIQAILTSNLLQCEIELRS